MKRLVTTIATAALSLGLVQAAAAADLPAKARPYAPPPPAYSWTGFYIGGNVGFASGTTSLSDPDDDWHGATFDRRKNSFTGGLQAGANYQTGRAVFGVEVDYNYLKLGQDTNYSLDLDDGHRVRISSSWNWLATVRGRAGVAIDDVLVYLTAGAAFAKPKLSWTEFDDAPDSWAEFGNVRVGWTIGGGIEYALWTNWSVKLEGLYVDLGKFESTNPLGYRLEVNNTAILARVGLNYRFGAAGPVVAKY